MTKKQRPAPVAVKGMTFAEVIAEARRKQDEEQKRVEAMTPEEQRAYIAQREKDRAEALKLAQELGLAVVRVG